jgi:hypothetical protein
MTPVFRRLHCQTDTRFQHSLNRYARAVLTIHASDKISSSEKSNDRYCFKDIRKVGSGLHISSTSPSNSSNSSDLSSNKDLPRAGSPSFPNNSFPIHSSNGVAFELISEIRRILVNSFRVGTHFYNSKTSKNNATKSIQTFRLTGIFSGSRDCRTGSDVDFLDLYFFVTDQTLKSCF